MAGALGGPQAVLQSNQNGLQNQSALANDPLTLHLAKMSRSQLTHIISEVKVRKCVNLISPFCIAFHLGIYLNVCLFVCFFFPPLIGNGYTKQGTSSSSIACKATVAKSSLSGSIQLYSCSC